MIHVLREKITTDWLRKFTTFGPHVVEGASSYNCFDVYCQENHNILCVKEHFTFRSLLECCDQTQNIVVKLIEEN